MTKLQKRDLSQKQAFEVYPKIQAAFEAGEFKEAAKYQELYESLTANAIKWEQAALNA